MSSTYIWDFKLSGASEASKLANILDRIDKALSRLTRAQQQAGHSSSRLSADLSSSAASSSKFTSSLGSGAGGLGKYATAAGAAGAAVVVLSGVMRVATAVFTKITDLSAKAAGNLRKYGAEASTSRAALTAFFGANSNVEKSVETLARTTEYTQSQMNEFAVTMKRAGAGAGTITDIMPEVVKAARASGDSMAALGKTASNSLSQFSKSSETAADHLGNLVATANSTATSTGALRQGLANAATAANILGISGKDTLTMLGQLANAGLEGSKSGRYLRIAFERLSAPTADASRTLQQLGIDLSSLNLQDPADWLQVFSERMQGLDGADRIAALKPIFGASASALSVLIDKASGFDTMRQQIAGARAEIEKFSELKGESLQAAIDGWGSALEGFWKAGSKISNTLWKALYDAGSSALNKITDSIDKVSARFAAAGNDLDSWIDVMRNGGLSDIFSGLAESLQPEIESIKQLAEATLTGIGELMEAAIEGIDWEKLLEPLFEVGKKIGAGIASGVASYAPDAGAAAENYIDNNAPLPVKMVKNVGKFSLKNFGTAWKWGGAAVRGLSGLLPGGKDEQPDPDIDVDPSIVNTGSRPRPSGPPPTYDIDPSIVNAGSRPEAPDGRPLTASQLAKDERLKQYAAWSRSERAKLDRPVKSNAALTIQAAKNARESAAGEDFGGLDDEALKARKTALAKQAEYSQAKADLSRAEDEVKNSVGDAEIANNDWKSGIEQYLIRPFSKFVNLINSAREKYGQMIDSIRAKRVDFAEKFGLKGSDAANKDRQKILEDAQARDEKLLKNVQSPEKQADVEQRMADRAAALAEMTGKQSYAKDADKLLASAKKSTVHAEEDEIAKAEIQRKYAEENVSKLQKMYDSSENSGVRAEVGERLMAMFRDLGRAEEARGLMGSVSDDKMAAAVEEQQRRAEGLALQRAQVEEDRRQTEILTQIFAEMSAGGAIPEDPAFAM